MGATVVTLIRKPGCHLCDDARAVIDAVFTDLLAAGEPVPDLLERSILDDRDLHERYVEEIPVVLIDGEMHTYWRVDAARLRSAILR